MARTILSTPNALSIASLVLLAACASRVESETSDTRAALEAEHAAELSAGSGHAFRVEVSPELATVRHIEGRTSGASLNGATASAKALSFLSAHPKLLGLADVRQSLRVQHEQSSESGTHVRLQEVVSGVPVRGAEVIAHFDRAGDLVSMDARIVPGLRLDVVPVLAASAADERAKVEILTRVPDLQRAHLRDGAPPELVVFAEPARDLPARLAWHHVVRGMSETTAAVLDVTIDALTGDILEAFDDLETIKAKSPGVLGDEKEFEVTQTGTTFTLVDGTRSAPIRTFSAGTQQTLPGTLVASTQQNVWDNTPARGKGAAVDAHFYAAFVYDYYKSKFGRNGIDGQNSPMVSTVHFGTNYENAFWDGTQMAYGDGATRFKPLSAGLDVVAHEFTHGVTTSTSKLVYQGQPGALNEAVSDILSTYIEHAYKPDDRNNWVTGELVSTAPIRDLTNPKAFNQPSNMKEFVNTQQDNGGVHINSGIPNNAAYLMTMSGTNPYSKVKVGGKLGWEKAEKLWYEVETKYLMARTDFAGAATMTVNAATALGYTPADVAVVKCAWVAVGVLPGPCDPLADGTATPTPSGSGTPPATDGGSAAAAPTSSTGAPAPGARPPTAQNGLLTEPNNGCNQSGGTPKDLGPVAGLALALLALSRRPAARRPARRR